MGIPILISKEFLLFRKDKPIVHSNHECPSCSMVTQFFDKASKGRLMKGRIVKYRSSIWLFYFPKERSSVLGYKCDECKTRFPAEIVENWENFSMNQKAEALHSNFYVN